MSGVLLTREGARDRISDQFPSEWKIPTETHALRLESRLMREAAGEVITLRESEQELAQLPFGHHVESYTRRFSYKCSTLAALQALCREGVFEVCEPNAEGRFQLRKAVEWPGLAGGEHLSFRDLVEKRLGKEYKSTLESLNLQDRHDLERGIKLVISTLVPQDVYHGGNSPGGEEGWDFATRVVNKNLEHLAKTMALELHPKLAEFAAARPDRSSLLPRIGELVKIHLEAGEADQKNEFFNDVVGCAAHAVYNLLVEHHTVRLAACAK